MFSKSLFVLAAVAITVNAQSTTPPVPTGGLLPSTCVLGCVEPAASFNGCKGYTDLPCVCQSRQFQVDADACLRKFCPTEADSAKGLQQAFCGSSYSQTDTTTPTARTDFYGSVSVQTSTAPPSGSPSPTGSSSTKPTSSTSTGTDLEVGVGAFFGAILAAVFAL